MVKKIRQLIDYPAGARAMGEQARAVFEKNFSEGDIHRQLLAVYGRVVEGKKNAQIS